MIRSCEKERPGCCCVDLSEFFWSLSGIFRSFYVFSHLASSAGLTPIHPSSKGSFIDTWLSPFTSALTGSINTCLLPPLLLNVVEAVVDLSGIGGRGGERGR